MNKVLKLLVGLFFVFTSFAKTMDFESVAALFAEPRYFSAFSEPSTDMVPLLERYLQEPEYAADKVTYDFYTRKIYGADLSFNYPLPVLDFLDYQNCLAQFKASYPEFPGTKYITKMNIAPGAKIIMIGDLHGNIQALSRQLIKLMKEGFLDTHFNIVDKKNYLFFLGDFVDYGRYGADTLAMAMKLRIQNPVNVYVCRGNHEDEICKDDRFGFQSELIARYGRSAGADLMQSIDQAFDRMPLGIFVGVKEHPESGFVQLCHGGLGNDIEHEIDFLLTTDTHVLPLGSKGRNLQWGDFTGTPLDKGLEDVSGRGLKYDIAGTQEFLHRHNINYVFRGHQDTRYACKNLMHDVEDPTSLVPHRDSDKRALELYKAWLDENASCLEVLNATQFELGKFPSFIGPVFTFSNASGTKLNFEEGYGELLVANSWQKSKLKFYVFRPRIFQIHDCLDLAEDKCASQTEKRDIFEQYLIPGQTLDTLGFKDLDHCVNALNSALLLPRFTYIDAEGNPTIYLEEPQSLKAEILVSKINPSTDAIMRVSIPRGKAMRQKLNIKSSQFAAFYDQFKKPETISVPGISDELKTRFLAPSGDSVFGAAGCAALSVPDSGVLAFGAFAGAGGGLTTSGTHFSVGFASQHSSSDLAALAGGEDEEEGGDVAGDAKSVSVPDSGVLAFGAFAGAGGGLTTSGTHFPVRLASQRSSSDLAALAAGEAEDDGDCGDRDCEEDANFGNWGEVDF